MSAMRSGPAPKVAPPAIPLTLVDAPTQRLWAVSSVAAVQAYKLFFLTTLTLTGEASDTLAASSSSTPLFVAPEAVAVLLHPLFAYAVLLDLAIVATLAFLRIPRLAFPKVVWIGIAVAAALLDWIFLGGWRSLGGLITLVPLVGPLTRGVASLGDALNPWAGQPSIGGRRVRVRKLISPSEHIIGQHTIHILPYSTATLTPLGSSPVCHCLGPLTPQGQIFLPVLFNNTEPRRLQYSITPFGQADDSDAAREVFDVNIPKTALTRVGNVDPFEEGDELDAALYDLPKRGRAARSDERGGAGDALSSASTQKRPKTTGQRLFQLPVKRVGRVRLERVLDAKGQDARIERSDVLVVECPSSTFIPSPSDSTESQLIKASTWSKKTAVLSTLPALHQCPLDEATLHVRVHGLAPLELHYSRNWKNSATKATRSKQAAKSKKGQGKDDVDASFGAAPAPKDGVAQTKVISHIAAPHFATPLDGPEVSDSPDMLAAALRRAVRSEVGDYAWAAAQDVELPITLDLREAGTYTYQLERVRDACGNQLDITALVEERVTTSVPSDAVMTPTQDVVVHPRVQVSFEECSLENPTRVMIGQGKVKLGLAAQGTLDAASEWNVRVRYEPDSTVEGKQQAPWTRNVTLSTKSKNAGFVPAEGPGKYTLEATQGKWCAGEVGAPWTCPVLIIPKPSANITFQEIKDTCAGPVGVKALAVLVGTPPFRLEYQEQRKGEQARDLTRVIHQMREEIEFRPSEDGEVTYRFVKLYDKHYKNIALSGPETTQRLHPLASAKFVSPKDTRSTSARRSVRGQEIMPNGTIQTCEHDPVGRAPTAQVQLQGAGPFSLKYTLRADSDSTGLSTTTQHRIDKVNATNGTAFDLTASVPPELADGGVLTFTLDSISDAKGCERIITEPDLMLEVRRTRPSAAFVFSPSRERGETYILHNAKAKLPVRLAGDGPWKVSLELHELGKKGKLLRRSEVRLKDADDDIIVDQPGRYVVAAIKDAHCSGTVVAKQSEFDVILRPRPTIAFDAKHVVPISNGTQREAVCVGQPDAVDLIIDGHFPLQITYEHTMPGWTAEEVPAVGDDAVLDALPSSYAAHGGEGGKTEHTFNAAQKVTSFQLATLTPGLHTYRLKSIGDTVYAPFAVDDVPVLHQQVHALPSAKFEEVVKGVRPAFCVGDEIAPKAFDNAAVARIPGLKFTGQGPWDTVFRLREPGGRRVTDPIVHTFTERSSALQVPGYTFQHVGRHFLTIQRLEDATGCVRRKENAVKGSMELELEVAETASIRSAGTRDDFCVGESVDFVLQGSAPWSVHFTFDGKASRVRANSAAFSRIADRAGELRITKVAHETNRCGKQVEGEEGMVKKIHALPTVAISGGRNYIEDLREGTQAEINFKLQGVPPFSFTFQRTEPADRFANPKVLETRTVTGVQTNKWSTFASEEGTWSVTWLQDRYCAVSLLTGASGKSNAGAQKLLEL